ncbi:nucleotidyl transferase AbiEii/AbiGii toxin family protein [Oerskovia enterophila]|uniref:Nucleotidyl transferase AbiEii toxin, Type IV TA system n=1 Tax=Oerskovia enterophila TaxID=43678 RepID=A0ABX2Y790_9CELL|nr:nucleotidyl transferase AbiEii/AbiGii toxin family protein [Oerskovia enterophila]OCI32153.1 hypothetical protein OERS_11250 [Oerskovia enterophila]
MTQQSADLPQGLAELPAKNKEPASVTVLNSWLLQAEKRLGDRGGRLAWLVASTVVIAALQRALDTTGQPLFLLKGGTLLQHRLPSAPTRATKDVDGLIRGDIDDFLAKLDDEFAEPWGPLTLRRDAVEVIQAPARVVKPRRFDVVVELRGKTWRRIQVEIAPDEGSAGAEPEPFTPPTLAGLGLPDPTAMVGIAMRYQVAQKIHACTDPHDPPTAVNDRARDVVDLLLLRDLAEIGQDPAVVRAAVVDIFVARARDAQALSRAVRAWPCVVVAHPHWPTDYARAAADAQMDLTLDEAVAELNAWLAQIDAAVSPANGSDGDDSDDDDEDDEDDECGDGELKGEHAQ